MKTAGTDTLTYCIPEWLVGEALARIKKLARKAKRLGLDEPTYRAVGMEKRPRYGKDGPIRMWDGTLVYDQWVHIEVTRPIINLPGWEFLGTVQHTEVGNILWTRTREDLTAYRDADPTCEHCNTKRRRKDTYLLRESATGNITRVGSTCVNSYIGEDVLKALEVIRDTDFGDMEEREYTEGGLRHDYFGTEDVLAVAALVIRVNGWLPKSKADPCMGHPATADIVREYLTDADGKFARDNPKLADGPSTQDKGTGSGALGYVTALDAGTNNYLGNLKVACGIGIVTRREMGLVVSAVPCYQREVERCLAAQQAGTSEHIGNVGDKLGRKLSKADKAKGAQSLPAQVGTITAIRTFEGQYGVTTLVKIQTEQGNMLTWFASGEVKSERGDRVTVIGTIKKLGTYQDTPETVLTRVALTPVQEQAA